MYPQSIDKHGPVFARKPFTTDVSNSDCTIFAHSVHAKVEEETSVCEYWYLPKTDLYKSKHHLCNKNLFPLSP